MGVNRGAKMNAREFGELSRNKRNDRNVRLRENWNRLHANLKKKQKHLN